MKSFTILALSICLLQAITNNAQSVITEWSLPGEIENIQLYPTLDAMYLSYADNRSHSDFEIFQIRSDGTYKPILFEQREHTALVGVHDDGDNTLFYYLTGKKKDLSLIAMKYNHATATGTWLADEFEIDGAVVGIPMDSVFSLIIYNKIINQLRVVKFNQLTATYETCFNLPFSFADSYTNITYIHNDSLTSIDEGAAKFKLYKKSEKLILSVDHSFPESSYEDPHTSVMMFDLTTGTQTLKSFHTRTKHNFRTFLYKDLLYRSSTSKKRFELEVIDFNSGEVIQKKQLVRDTLFKESFVYLRNGKTYRVTKRESLYNMMSTSNTCEPSVIVLPSKRFM